MALSVLRPILQSNVKIIGSHRLESEVVIDWIDALYVAFRSATDMKWIEDVILPKLDVVDQEAPAQISSFRSGIQGNPIQSAQHLRCS